MKFTNGYWLTKPEFRMSYATQCVRAEATEKSLRLLAACRAVRGRGDVLNGATIRVVLTAPRSNIIRVQVTHFAGEADPGPHFETYEEENRPEIRIGKDEAVFRSGKQEVPCQFRDQSGLCRLRADGLKSMEDLFRCPVKSCARSGKLSFQKITDPLDLHDKGNCPGRRGTPERPHSVFQSQIGKDPSGQELHVGGPQDVRRCPDAFAEGEINSQCDIGSQKRVRSSGNAQSLLEAGPQKIRIERRGTAIGIQDQDGVFRKFDHASAPAPLRRLSF